MAKATFRIWRGDRTSGQFQDYETEASEGMVVLDAVHRIQAEQANDLAVRWNCKAGKCGSCSAEINGKPKLMCMTRLDTIDITEPVTIERTRLVPPAHRRMREPRDRSCTGGDTGMRAISFVVVSSLVYVTTADAQPKLIADLDHLAVRKWPIAQIELQWLVESLVEFQNRARAQLDDLLHALALRS